MTAVSEHTAEATPKRCRSAWYDGKSGHICGLDDGHEGPHICATEGAREGDKPITKEDPNRRYGFFPG